MGDAQSLRQAVESRAPLSTWFGVVLLFALFGVIVLAVLGPTPRGDDYEQKRAKAREEKLKTLREAEAKELATYGWIDKNKRVVRLPIDRAMELTVADLATKQPAPAYPIATPAPPEPQPSTARSASSTRAGGTAKATSTQGPGSEKRSQSAAAPVSPSPAPPSSPAGRPLPVQGKTPP
jgi:hypothetical protein